MTVAYDGRGFSGFAANEGVATVGGTLATTLGRILRTGAPVAVTCAGRTDAGVHGWGQVVSFDAPVAALERRGLDGLVRSCNAMMAPAIAVRDARFVPSDFDARFSAVWRRYRYTVLNSATPSPFEAATAWHLPHHLDIDEMNLGCDPFIGEHDFSSFCRRPRTDAPVSMTRRVFDAGWTDLGDDRLRFEIRANAFCHQMVRSIVGLLVDVGLGKRRAGEIAAVLRARDRSAAGQIAPPHGLCLWEVGYPSG
ncbi:MAG: tRNA pseudouridine(38-40) synthase TruA [Acidimicrobiia bacterium]